MKFQLMCRASCFTFSGVLHLFVPLQIVLPCLSAAGGMGLKAVPSFGPTTLTTGSSVCSRDGT